MNLPVYPKLSWGQMPSSRQTVGVFLKKKNNLGNQNLVKLPILMKVNRNDEEKKNVCEQKFRKLCVSNLTAVFF